MPSLLELQRAFVRYMVAQESTTILPLVRPAGLSSERRLNVYRNNITTTHTDALDAIYPVIRRLVGDDFFCAAARAYGREHPSLSGDVNDYGTRFPDFLADFGPGRELVYLPDVARLELAIQQAFYALDHEGLDLHRLAQVPRDVQGKLRFKLHPSVGLVSSPYPILRIWQANQDDAGSGQVIDLDAGADRVVIMRPGMEIEFLRVGDGEFALLDGIARRTDFETACQAALAIDAGLDLGGFFAFCVRQDLIVDFEQPLENTP